MKRRKVVAVVAIVGAMALAVGAMLAVESSSGPRAGDSSRARDGASALAADHRVSVRFDASVGSGMPWLFKAPVTPIAVPPGQQARVFYTASNPTDEPVLGTAVFNVVPYEATPYFKKVECFCFTEQLLMPGATATLPVAFVVDPKIADDPATKEIREIVASYTFFNMGHEARDRYLSEHGPGPERAAGTGK